MPDVTVASTTDTQDQVNQAAGAVQTEETEERPVPTGDAQVESGEPEATLEPEKKAEEKEKHVPRAVDKRIDKLTREKGELQRRLEELETKFQERAAAPPPEVKKEEKVADTADKPTPDKYQTYEEYLEAMAEYKADQKIDARLRKMAEEEEKQQVEAAHKTIVDGYNERMTEFKKTHDDFDEVVGGTEITLPQGVISTIVELENGPAVAYYLSANPDEAKKVAAAPLLSAIALVGKISARLEKEVPADATPNGKSPDRKPVVSGAPPPMRPLGGGAIRSTVDLNDPNLSYEDYKKARATQEKARRGY